MILVAFQLAAATTLNVGATVVRFASPPSVRVERGRIVVRAQGALVGAEGGRVSRAGDGTAVIAPDGAFVRIVLTY
jgi:hypothetical protein